MQVISPYVLLMTLLTLTTFECLAQSSTAEQPAKSPQAASELLKTAWAEFDANDLESSLVTVNKAIALNPNLGSAFVLHFLIMNRKDPALDSSVDCTRIIELAPSKEWVEEAYVSRGNSRLIKRNLDEAIDDFNHAISMNPRDAHAYGLRSFTYLTKGELVNARADYEKGLEIDAAQPSPFVVRAFWLRNKDEFGLALADYDNAIKWKPEYAEAFVHRGIILGLMGNIDECLSSFRKGLALNPDVLTEDNRNGVGRSPYWDLQAFINSHSNSARAYEMRGLFRLLQQKRDDAQQDFKQTLDREPALKSEIDRIIQSCQSG